MPCTKNTHPSTAARSSTPASSSAAARRGATVKSAQQRLNVKGARITADGKFGDATYAAVVSFQKASGLTVDGSSAKSPGPGSISERPRPRAVPVRGRYNSAAGPGILASEV